MSKDPGPKGRKYSVRRWRFADSRSFEEINQIDDLDRSTPIRIKGNTSPLIVSALSLSRFLEITRIPFHLMHHHRTLVKQDYNRLISRLSIQTQMATFEDKLELAVHSLKINQLAETLGSGKCSLGKAFKRRYTNEGFTTFISSMKLTEDEITSTVETGKEDEDECKRALAGVMSSSNGANISGEKERKDLRREGITHQLILTQIDNTLFIKESGPDIILAQVFSSNDSNVYSYPLDRNARKEHTYMDHQVRGSNKDCQYYFDVLLFTNRYNHSLMI
ncbi:hypothetical protein LXL04_021672 [Taraxacum kok-saghyz]